MKLLRRTHGWPEGDHPLSLFSKDLQLKAHAAYPRAKAGDETAVLDLLLDMAVAWLYEHRARFAPGLFAELANYIQHGGGKIQDVVVLVNAGRNPALVPQPKNVQLLNRRFGDEIFNIFGIKPEALTANEAQYLVGFRSVDEIRNRLAAATQEIDRRLRSKGIARAFEGKAAGLHAVQGLSGAGTPVPGSHNKPHPRGS